jgi:hypothetical protein
MTGESICESCETKLSWSFLRADDGVQFSAKLEPAWDNDHVLEVDMCLTRSGRNRDHVRVYLVHFPEVQQ